MFAAPWVMADGVKGANERIALGHIGVGNEGRYLLTVLQACKGAQFVAFADAYKDRREACAEQCGGKAYADFRDLFGAKRHRRGGCRHAGSLACAHRRRRSQSRQGRLCREAAGSEHRAGPDLPQGLRGTEANLPVRHATAEHGPLPPWLRTRPQRADRQGPHDRGDRPQRRRGRIDEGSPRAAQPRLRRVGRPGDHGALHRRSLPSAGNLLDLRLFDRLPGRLGRPPVGHHGLGQRRRSVGPGDGGRHGHDPGQGPLRHGLQLGHENPTRRCEDDLQARRRLDEVHRLRGLGPGPSRRLGNVVRGADEVADRPQRRPSAQQRQSRPEFH